MRKREIQYCIESLAYIMGAGRITDEVEARIARMDQIMWAEMEAVLMQKAEPVEEAAALKQQESDDHPAETEPEQAPDTACPVEDPEADAAPEQQEPEPTQGEVLAKDRPECRKCQYIERDYCQYILVTGKSRGCSVAECEHWKDPKPKKKRQQAPTIRRKYRHTCHECGKLFIDYSTRTKICPECAEAKQ